MTKTQKIWLWIFIAMFALPEILWSPVANFLFSFFSSPVNGIPQLLSNNFLFNFENEALLKLIIVIQFLGIVLFVLSWFKNKKSINSKTLFGLVTVLGLILLVITLFIIYLIFVFSPNFL